MHLRVPQGHMLYMSLLKMSFGVIGKGKGHSQYFYDLCLIKFGSVGRLKKNSLATKFFHEFGVNPEIFRPIEDSAYFIVVKKTVLL